MISRCSLRMRVTISISLRSIAMPGRTTAPPGRQKSKAACRALLVPEASRLGEFSATSSERTFTAAVAHLAGNLQTQSADVLYHNIANSRISGKKKSRGALRAATYKYYAAELRGSSQPEHRNKICQRLRDDCSRIAERLGDFMGLRVRNRHELTQAPFRPIQSQNFPI
jgi:hypothetical protein